jgi:hypothetical protein
VVEITADLANGKFEIGRSLTIADDPMLQQAGDRFGDIGAVCHEYSPDGREIWMVNRVSSNGIVSMRRPWRSPVSSARSARRRTSLPCRRIPSGPS